VKRGGQQVIRDIDELLEWVKQNSRGDGLTPSPEASKNRKSSSEKPSIRRTQASPPPKKKSKKRQRRSMEESWGHLPKEMRQTLLDRNFKEFTPEYELAIKRYFRVLLTNRWSRG